LNNGNWWEFYFVRYFIGSIFGSLIIIALVLHPDSGVASTMASYTDFDALKIKDISAPFLLGLLFLGTAFCYVASAPILVLHALRYRFQFTWSKKSSLSRWLIFIILFGFFYAAVWKLNSFTLLRGLMSLAAFFIVYSQIFMLASSIKAKNAHIFDFYRRLAKDRANQKIDRKEFVESYRHLREHGNAFLILVCESALGMALFFCTSINELILTTFFWLIPTVPIWFVATYLESRLKNV